jgi:hypothetical protein
MPLEAITADHIDAYNERLLSKRHLGARLRFSDSVRQTVGYLVAARHG